MTPLKYYLLMVWCTILTTECTNSYKTKDSNIENGPVVQIEDGAIRGRLGHTVDLNKTYFAFQGIPYAKPPVGNLRFRAPLPISKWNNILNATKDASECLQINVNSLTSAGSEDCLYISVYTPNISAKKLPVMVFIHGGFYVAGSSSYDLYGPDYLLNQDVVYVSFNYRLGIFGFLSLEDVEQPGNNGLRDQILALQWIQKNIVHFGGNPRLVTVFGQSAGSASALFLLQSHLTKDLFQHVILQSGSSLCQWTLTTYGKKVAFEIGKDLKLNLNSTKTLVDGLRLINAQLLQTVVRQKIIKYAAEGNPFGRGSPFAPVIELPHEGAIITDSSYRLLTEGKFHRIPIMMGFTSQESSLAFNKNNYGTNIIILLISGRNISEFEEHQTLLVPPDMNIKNKSKLKAVANAIKLKYFENSPVDQQLNQYAQYSSDNLMVRAIHKTVKLQSIYTPVYFYRFSYEGGLGGVSNRTIPGVGHIEDLGYIFRTSNSHNSSASETDKLMRNRTVKLWTNFAKYGNPTPHPEKLLNSISWNTAALIKNNLIYLDINTNLSLQLNPEKLYMKFWDKLYTKVGNAPFYTY